MRFTTMLALMALSVSATATAQQASTSTSKDSDRKPITVVGCLQAGAQSNQFVLAATPDQLAKGVAVATSGTVPNVTYMSAADRISARTSAIVSRLPGARPAMRRKRLRLRRA